MCVHYTPNAVAIVMFLQLYSHYVFSDVLMVTIVTPLYIFHENSVEVNDLLNHMAVKVTMVIIIHVNINTT